MPLFRMSCATCRSPDFVVCVAVVDGVSCVWSFGHLVSSVVCRDLSNTWPGIALTPYSDGRRNSETMSY